MSNYTPGSIENMNNDVEILQGILLGRTFAAIAEELPYKDGKKRQTSYVQARIKRMVEGGLINPPPRAGLSKAYTLTPAGMRHLQANRLNAR